MIEIGPYRKAIEAGEGIEAGKREVEAKLAERVGPGTYVFATSSSTLSVSSIDLDVARLSWYHARQIIMPATKSCPHIMSATSCFTF
jgi:hypothetical protein